MIRKCLARCAIVVCLLARMHAAGPPPAPVQRGEEPAISTARGEYGGRLNVGQRSEPKTLNPVLAADAVSREVIGRLMADLVHINRATQQTEPALVKGWKLSPDGRAFTLQLRRGVRFSDGHPFNADDVVFSFGVYLDEQLHSPQRDLLIINGKPLAVAKVDAYTVRITLPEPYAAAERIFDSVAMLPRHVLEQPYRQGKFAQVWSVAAGDVVGLGPFRVKQYVAGQRLVLERNPYYWKIDAGRRRLPYLDEITFLFVGTEDAQLLRFQAGETDVISRVSAENYSLLSRDSARQWQLADLGPSLEYNFLVFNLNDLSNRKLDAVARKQSWFRQLAFRQAVSLALDRDALVRLVYGGHGAALWGNVSPGNKLWVNNGLPHPGRSVERARALLLQAGFRWRQDGTLLDNAGQPVEFTIVSSSSNGQRMKMATLVQEDLRQLGMRVTVVPLEFRAMLDRIFQSFDYEAAIMALGGGDADPNPEMNVWLSSGGTHLWHMQEPQPLATWQRDLNQLMKQQMVTLHYKDRKRLYDRAQQLIAENMPFVFLASPNVLTAAKDGLSNFHPAVLDHYTLWNVEELFWRAANNGRKDVAARGR